MRIGLISQWYDPEQGSAAVPGVLARALTGLGHEVRVLTGFPNYPYGRVYDGYRQRLRCVEQVRGSAVRRVPLYTSHAPSPSRRALNDLSFAASAAVLGVSHLKDVDVCLVFSSPGTVALPAMVGKALFGTPFLLSVQDLWPDSVLASGLLRRRTVSRAVERTLTAGCAAIYRAADRIAVISPGMQALLEDRGVPAAKLGVIYNWVDENVFIPRRPPARVPSAQAPFTVMYAGSIGHVQGLEVAVEAMAQLRDLPDVRLRFVGNGVAVPSLRALAADLAVGDRVVFDEAQPLDRMSELMSTADVQLVALRDLPLFHATMPSKIQAILASALPVVTSAPGDVGALVQQAGAGLACPPGDSLALARAIRHLRSLDASARTQLGLNGRLYYDSELSSLVGSKRLESTLLEIARERRRRVVR